MAEPYRIARPAEQPYTTGGTKVISPLYSDYTNTGDLSVQTNRQIIITGLLGHLLSMYLATSAGSGSTGLSRYPVGRHFTRSPSGS